MIKVSAHRQVFLFHHGANVAFTVRIAFTVKVAFTVKIIINWSKPSYPIHICVFVTVYGSFLFVILSRKRKKKASLCFFAALSPRYMSMNDILISLVSILIWSNLKQISFPCSLKDFLYSHRLLHVTRALSPFPCTYSKHETEGKNRKKSLTITAFH